MTYPVSSLQRDEFSNTCVQVWADRLAAAENDDDLCDVIRELYQQEDIPYGTLIHPTLRIVSLLASCLIFHPHPFHNQKGGIGLQGRKRIHCCAALLSLKCPRGVFSLWR